jgi:hypothetical protein
MDDLERLKKATHANQTKLKLKTLFKQIDTESKGVIKEDVFF